MNDKILKYYDPNCTVDGIHRHSQIINEPFLLHTHGFYEFEYAIEGEGINCINGVEYPVSAGSIWAEGPDDDHRICGTGLKIYHVGIYPAMVSEDISNLIQNIQFPLCGHIEDEKARERIKNCFELLMYGTPSHPHYRELVQATAKTTILCLFPYLSTAQTTTNKISAYVRQAICYLRDHASEDIRLADVANTLHIASCYLSSIFTQYVGCTFGEYLTRIRIGHARELLKNTELSIIDIAGRCGFGCASSMNRAFRKYLECSPSQVRTNGK